jgi:lysophospholipase-2
MWSVEDPSEQEEMQKEGLRESISAVIEIIYQEARLLPLSHIFLGGISQGSATAILALLCSEMKLGGFIGLCTWMPFKSGITEIANKHSGHNVGADALNQPHSQGSISKASHIAEGIRGLFEIVERAPAKNDAGRMAVADDKGHTAVNALATPVFLSHSKNDETVPIQNGRLLRDCLKALGMKVTWKEYMGGGHWIYEPEDENVRNGVDDIEEFVNLNSQG